MNENNKLISEPYSAGYLELIVGPMFSCKTTRLVEIYKQCKFCNISVTVINHTIDNRYDSELMTTHDKVKIPCVKTNQLMKLYEEHYDSREKTNKILDSKVILINEGQFFPDLIEFVQLMLTHNKKIYVCGLDGDFERKKFGQILDLIPICDKIYKLTSLCCLCKNGTKGIFSMRLTKETEQTVVGSENYIPVCRECYEKNII